MLQKGGILPCVDCAVFGKWNYSTVLFNKVKRNYCSDWCLCTVINLWTNALDKFNLMRFPWQISHEKSILGVAICQVRIAFDFFLLLLAKAFRSWWSLICFPWDRVSMHVTRTGKESIFFPSNICCTCGMLHWEPQLSGYEFHFHLTLQNSPREKFSLPRLSGERH